MNLGMYGAISTPRAMAVAANPIRPPLRTCNAFEVGTKRSISWSIIWLIRPASPFWWHSRTNLCIAASDSTIVRVRSPETHFSSSRAVALRFSYNLSVKTRTSAGSERTMILSVSEQYTMATMALRLAHYFL